MRQSPGTEAIGARHYGGILLLSLATLLLELALTRVLSVALWYHFGFLVISTALLGFGASGVTLSLWSRLRERAELDGALAICSLGFAASVVFSFWLLQRIPFDPFAAAVDHWQFLYMPLYFVLVALPFFFSGLAISLLLTRAVSNINRLYCYDLIGAGLGCGLIALVIPRFGGSGSVLFAAFVAALAAACFAARKSRALESAGLVCALVLLAASFQGDRIIPIQISQNKLPPAAAQIKPIYAAWNTMSLVEVYDHRAAGGQAGSRRIVIDAGTAATGITDLRPEVGAYLAAHPPGPPDSALAYLGKKNPTVLVIGSGGGGEVLEALQHHAASVTAVEINPAIVDIVSRRMNDYWGNLFHQPQVHLVTDEGRSFVRRSQQRYDAIISVHTITNAAMASGALSLAEDFVLTREAFEDYLEHLKPDGAIFVTRPEFQLPRLFATAREAFAALGMGSIEGHVFAYAGPQLIPGRASFSGGFLLQKTALQPGQMAAIGSAFAMDRAAAAKAHRSLRVLYAPDDPHPGSIYDRIVSAADLGSIYSSVDEELAPATDDKPFFNQHTRWSRIRWATVHDLFSQYKPLEARLALEDKPIAGITLGILLAQSVLIAGLCILVPLAFFDQRSLRFSAGRWRWLTYFAALGLGFIMIEIALLQRFQLFLGEPIYTYAVVLAGLLIFTGIGSLVADRMAMRAQRALLGVLPLVVGVLLATSWAAPALFHQFLGARLAARMAISLLLIAPLGFVLGMPFPLGLRLVMQRSSALGSWAWGVNGFFTVIGTVLAAMLGMMIGFLMVLLLAGICYLAALGAMASLHATPMRASAEAAPAGQP